MPRARRFQDAISATTQTTPTLRSSTSKSTFSLLKRSRCLPYEEFKTALQSLGILDLCLSKNEHGNHTFSESSVLKTFSLHTKTQNRVFKTQQMLAV